MKNVLLATTALVMSAGFAAAEVTLSGDARMGLWGDDDETIFIHRARVKFTLSGESDSGFSFGASFRAGDADSADNFADGAGEVFISGAFGTLTMGDIDNAALTVVGQVDGVGLTGLDDMNEIIYLGHESTAVRYDYAAGGFSFSASTGQNYSDSYSVAGAYSMDGYKFSLGYEKRDVYIGTFLDGWVIENHVILGADASFGDVTMKARYGVGSGYEDFWGDDADLTQMALSATYSMDALSLTAFYATSKLQAEADEYSKTDRYGLGVAYDLGGGAALKAGYASAGGSDRDGGPVWTWDRYNEWDLGLSFSF